MAQKEQESQDKSKNQENDESDATGKLGEGELPNKFNSASPKKIGGNKMQAFGFMNRLGKKNQGDDDDGESV